MDMIERVARAICRAGICGPRAHLDEQESLHWRKFQPEARAAIKAMREPTHEMIMSPDGNSGCAEEVWAAMIDTALRPEGPICRAVSQYESDFRPLKLSDPIK